MPTTPFRVCTEEPQELGFRKWCKIDAYTAKVIHAGSSPSAGAPSGVLRRDGQKSSSGSGSSSGGCYTPTPGYANFSMASRLLSSDVPPEYRPKVIVCFSWPTMSATTPSGTAACSKMVTTVLRMLWNT